MAFHSNLGSFESWSAVVSAQRARLVKLKAENVALRAQVERLSAPVSDEEWFEGWIGKEIINRAYMERRDIDALIAARKEEGNG